LTIKKPATLETLPTADDWLAGKGKRIAEIAGLKSVEGFRRTRRNTKRQARSAPPKKCNERLETVAFFY
jgi:hypothetical protein